MLQQQSCDVSTGDPLLGCKQEPINKFQLQKSSSIFESEKHRLKTSSGAASLSVSTNKGDTSKPLLRTSTIVEEKSILDNQQARTQAKFYKQEDGRYLCERHRNVWKKVDHADSNLNPQNSSTCAPEAAEKQQKASKKADQGLLTKAPTTTGDRTSDKPSLDSKTEVDRINLNNMPPHGRMKNENMLERRSNSNEETKLPPEMDWARIGSKSRDNWSPLDGWKDGWMKGPSCGRR